MMKERDNRSGKATPSGIYSLRRADAITAVHEKFGIKLVVGPGSGGEYYAGGTRLIVPAEKVYLDITFPEGDMGPFWKAVDKLAPLPTRDPKK